jgi:hypothetical protein
MMLCLASSTEAAIYVLQANLDVAQEGRTEPPPTNVPPPPSGVAIMVYDDVTNMFDLNAAANGLILSDSTSPIFMRDSHIHFGAPLSAGGTAGPVIHPFGSGAPGGTGPWVETLPGFLELHLNDQVFTRAEEINPATGQTRERDLLNNLTYLNLHSNRNPGGEIRGQLIVIPEPATMSVLCLGSLALLARRRNA